MMSIRLAGLPLACLFLAAPVHALTLNDTGQIACYNASETSTGTVSQIDPSPEDMGFEGQDCSFGASAADAVGLQLKIGASNVPGRDYTKIANDGSELPPTATRGPNPGDWGCTRDNITGLLWELRTDDAGLRDIDHRYAWGNQTPDTPNTCGGTLSTCNTDAYAVEISALNGAQGLCGRSDWRLPTPLELSGLIAYQTSLAGAEPNLIDREYFPDQTNTQAVNGFWTGTTATSSITFFGSTAAWGVDFANAALIESSKTADLQLRMVSGEVASPTERFVKAESSVSGEFTTVDTLTGLEWKTCVEGRDGADCSGSETLLDWSQALTAAANEDYAGHTDWRLPTLSELGSIRDFAAVASLPDNLNPPVIDTAAFPESSLGSAQYWSSTSDPLGPDFGMSYRYQTTLAHERGFKSNQHLVRLVRGGRFLEDHGPGGDTAPNTFSFADATVAAGALAESAPVVVGGLLGPASVRVTGEAESAYSINGSPYSALAGAVRNGDSIRLRHRAAASIGGTAATTLEIGSGSATFTSTAGDSRTPQTITFGANPGPLEVFTAARSVSASSDSGLAVSYGATPEAVCSVDSSSGELTLRGLGDCTVTANQGGNTEFAPADPQTQIVVVTRASQSIVFDTPTEVALSRGTLTVTASGGGTNAPVSVNDATPAVCTGSGVGSLTVTLVGVGTCALTATQPGNALYLEGQGTAQFEVTAVSPSLPGAPTNLVVVPRVGSVTLEFDAPTNDGGSEITAYRWTARPSSGDTLSGTCDLGACDVAAGIESGQSYTFGIAAINIVGTGPRTEATSATAIPAPAVLFPGAPTGVRVTDVGALTLGLAWDPVVGAGSATIGYLIEVATNAMGPFTEVGFASETFVTVTGLDPLTEYFFRITAVDENGTPGSPSAVISVETDSSATAGSDLIRFVNVTRTRFPEGFRGDPGFRIEADAAVRRVVYVEQFRSDEPNLGEPGRRAKKRKTRLDLTGFDGTKYVIEPPALIAPANYSGRSRLKATARAARASRTAPAGRARLELTFYPVNDPPLANGAGTTQTSTPLGKGLTPVQIPGFISNVHPGALDEQEDEAQQIVAYFVHPDPANATPSPVSNVSIDAAGTLRFDVDGSVPNANGYRYAFSLTALDDGEDRYADGQCLPDRVYGAYDQRACSHPQKFSIVVGEHTGVNLSAFRDTRAELEAELANAAKIEIEESDILVEEVEDLGEPNPLTYRMEVSNLGTTPVSGARFATEQISGLRDVSWTCTTPVGVCTPASGTGAVNTRFDLGGDNATGRAVITLLGKPVDGSNWVEISGRASMPNGSGDTPIDTARILEAVTEAALFRGGFE